MDPLPVVVDYQSHCDDDCGLGVAYYTCPWCKKDIRDYGNGWFGRDDGPGSVFECYKCNAKLLRQDPD